MEKLENKGRFTDEHLVIFRTGGSLIDPASYNCQEIGLAKILRKKGLRVTVILAGAENRKMSVGSGDSEVSVIFRKYKCINQELAWFENAEKLLNELKPTIVQIHDLGMLMSWRVARWCHKKEVPVCLVQGSYELNRKPLFRFLESMFNKTFGASILRYVDAIGCKTPGAAMYIGNYTNKRTMITPIGLDTAKFTSISRQNWRNKLNIPTDAKILLYVGVFSARRHPLFMIDVLSELPKDYYMVMVGKGELEQNMIERACAHGISDRLILTGQLPQADLPALYEDADMFLLPSDYEIYGMVILEAMYFGLPVMAHSTAGAEMLISSGIDGILRSDYDAKAWARDITDCFNDLSIKQMGCKASDKIKKDYLWSSTVESFINMYSQAKHHLK